MCFGNQTQKTVNSTTSVPQWLTSAGQNNLNFASNLQSQGFTPYGGQQVASFSPQQSRSFGDAGNIDSSVNGGPIGQLTTNYANAPAQSVSADTIASRMSPYMNQYVGQALAPQLDLQQDQFNSQNKSFDSSATGAGAFGDTGWGLGRSNLTKSQDMARSGLVANAYNTAFNTAIGAGAQDVSNNLNAQTTDANLAETALGRQLTGANAMQGQQTGAATLNNTMGGQQTAQQQADLNAKYNQWQMGQQYPFQTTQLVNQTLGSARGVAPTSSTQTTSAPDNSGWGMLGSAIGTVGSIAAAPFTGGMSLAALPALAGGFTQSGNAFASSNPGSDYNVNNGWVPSVNGGGVMPAMADGGAVEGGKPVMVGERGPEVIVPGANSVVIPNEVLRAAQEKRDAALKKMRPVNMKFGIAA